MATASETQKNPDRPTVSVFENGQNTRIKNSSITVNNITSVDASTGVRSDPLDNVYKNVATNAILNAGGRADEVKCYPGTRERIIGQLERWMDGKEVNFTKMLWLSGPAGAGKSAIVQTIAERCRGRGVHAASFFFFRADPTRNSAVPFMATLLYQIFKFSATARQAVAAILSADPLAFGASIPDQFKQLLSSPFQGLPVSPPTNRRIVLLIDGLDECDSESKQSQRQILQSLWFLVTEKGSPFLALVASRAEPQIISAVKELLRPVHTIFLDDQYKPEDDIRLFVAAKFNEIKNYHHLSHTLGHDWPSAADAEEIVQKSSGQFIFVATVMRFIAMSSASPRVSLEMVQGIIPPARNSPFAPVDAIYMYILQQAEDQEAVKDILLADLLTKHLTTSPKLTLTTLLEIYKPAKYGRSRVQSYLSDLLSILQFHEDKLVLYHASMTDFLRDNSRSGEYHTDVDKAGTKFLPRLWGGVSTHHHEFHSICLYLLHRQKEPTYELRIALTSLSALELHLRYARKVGTHWTFLFDIYRLYHAIEIEIYELVLRQTVFLNVSAGRNYGKPMEQLPHVRRYFRFYRARKWLRLI